MTIKKLLSTFLAAALMCSGSGFASPQEEYIYTANAVEEASEPEFAANPEGLLTYDPELNEVTGQRRESYSEALAEFAGEYFIDHSGYIDSTVSRLPRADYLLDYMHPNASSGVRLYSEAVILSSN